MTCDLKYPTRDQLARVLFTESMPGNDWERSMFKGHYYKIADIVIAMFHQEDGTDI